ncbi:hypothetical protein BGZ70_005850, partial [Mortierella alpina]
VNYATVLYREFANEYQLQGPEQMAFITPTPEISANAERRRQGFSTQVLVQPDPGPRASEVNLTDLNIAMDKTTGNTVKFTYMDLVACLFPEIYVFGHSAFQLRHQKHSLQRGLMATPRQELPQVPPPWIADPVQAAQQLVQEVEQLLEEPAGVDEGAVEGEGPQDQGQGMQGSRARFTIKAYAKMRLLHFDRTWARNPRFLTFFFDWSNKDNVYGYRLRSTTSTRGGAGEATRVSDVLQ